MIISSTKSESPELDQPPVMCKTPSTLAARTPKLSSTMIIRHGRDDVVFHEGHSDVDVEHDNK